MAPGHILDTLGDPCIVLLDETQLPKVIVLVRVKTGADENHLGLELFQPGYPEIFDQFPHFLAFGVGSNRKVQHVGGRVVRAAVGVERMLENADHQYPVVAPQYVFGAIAVMHIKINHRHTFEAVALQRMPRGNSDLVENAKTHRTVMAGVMAGWTHGAKSIFDFTCNDAVGGGKHRAASTHRGVPGVGVERGVGVNLRIMRAARFDVVGELLAQAVYRGNHHAVVRKLYVTDGGQRRLAAVECILHAGCKQPVLNCIEPLRTLWMSRAHFVTSAVFMGEIAGRVHDVKLLR